MPKLYYFENYDECLNGEIHSLKNVYCYVDVVIKPNTSSSVWTVIEVYLKYYYLVHLCNISYFNYSRKYQITQKLDFDMII